MFMQSFENTDKQQRRRQQRQLALQRMEEAAANNVDDDDDVDNLLNGDTIGSTASNHYVDENVSEQRDHPWNRTSTETTKTSNTLTSAANFLRESQESYSFEPATTTAAKQFLWDDQSAYSNGTNRSGPQANLQNIKNLQKKPVSGKGARWNAINGGGAGGLWSALPVWGGGQQVDATSVASGGSRYRDVEGERLLTLANERVKIDNMSVLDREFGHVANDDVEEEDYDSALRRRVFLNKDGTITHDGADESVSSRRVMRKSCLKTVKRPVVLLCAVGIAIAVVSGTMTMYKKFMTNDSSAVPTIEEEVLVDGENESTFEVVDIPPPPSVEQEALTELEVDGVKIDVDKVRFEQIRSVILDSQVSTPAAIQDTTSAQFVALLWLVREDPMHLHPDSANLLQRYGLVVLWFSTTKNKYYHVSGEYTTAENQNRRKLNEQDADKWFQHDSWLSERGVCEWSGITCNPPDDGLEHVGNYDGDVTAIDLRRNNLRGAFPSEVFRALPFLKALDLSNNALAGTISKDIGQLSGLEYLNFTANNIAGSIPDSIGDLSNLKVFDMSFNQLGHTIPYSIYKLEKLRELDLSRNTLAATIPHEIGAMKELTFLNLAYNSLEGSLPHELNNMKSLFKLDVSYNKLQSSVPKEIGSVTYLRSLNLSHNKFEGELPNSIGNLEQLDELLLNDNEFKGGIPPELSKLNGLDVLNLANNHFTGIFPIWLTHLEGLKELDLSNNAIKGEIPQSIADMKNLRVLNLSRNDIMGMIPPEIGSLFKLEQIFLETNQLIGSVPDQLGELTSLRKLSLHNNFLTGRVSENICKLSNDMFLTQFTADCAGETAVILCECCQCHLHENIVHVNENNRYED